MKSIFIKQGDKGFTLIEILVVLAIIGILAGVVGISAVSSSQKSRDAKRQGDIVLLQSAIELYKNKYGRYPVGCNDVGFWSGQQGTSYVCSGGNTQYIVGLAPEFIPVLPKDNKLNGLNSGYIYRTNAAGTVYKLKAQRTVESEVVPFTHKFKSCDVRVGGNGSGGLTSGSLNRETVGWCAYVFFSSNNTPSACHPDNDEWKTSYAVWGGFLAKRTAPADTCGAQINCVPSIVQDTTDVICR